MHNGELVRFGECSYSDAHLPVRMVLILDLLLLFVFPLVIIITCYALLIRYIEKEGTKMNSSSTKHRKKVLRTVLLLVAIFVVFNMPVLLLDLYINLGHRYFKGEDLVREILEYFAFLNFGLNAFVYALSSSHFKKASQSWLCCCFKIQIHPSSIVSPTVASVDPETRVAVPSSTQAVRLTKMPSVSCNGSKGVH